MNAVVLLVSLLVLHPVVEEDTPLRLVATGTGDVPVHWILDGDAVAVTADGQAGHVNVSAGEHTVRAETDHDGPWRILVRPSPQGPGVTYVDGWSAQHTPAPAPTGSTPLRDAADPVPLALAALGLALVLVPWRRPKRP